jgi:hypothetical protein
VDWSNPLDIRTEDGRPVQWYHHVGGFFAVGCFGLFLLVGLTFVVLVWVSIGRALF